MKVEAKNTGTHDLRVVKVELPPAPKVQNIHQQAQQPIPQQAIEPQVPEKRKKKEVDDEVKKHFSNLDQVLNDFFVDEE